MPKKGNQFDSLFSSIGKQRSGEGSDSASARDTKEPEVRTTLYLPKSLHRKLKSAAVEEDRYMSDVVEELVAQWLEERQERQDG